MSPLARQPFRFSRWGVFVTRFFFSFFSFFREATHALYVLVPYEYKYSTRNLLLLSSSSLLRPALVSARSLSVAPPASPAPGVFVERKRRHTPTEVLLSRSLRLLVTSHHRASQYRIGQKKDGDGSENQTETKNYDSQEKKMKITVRTLRMGWSAVIDVPDKCLVGELRRAAATAADMPAARAKLVLRGAALQASEKELPACLSLSLPFFVVPREVPTLIE